MINLHSCSGNKNIGDFSRKKIIKTNAKFVKNYSDSPRGENLLVKRGRYSCLYNNGRLAAIGKQKGDKRIGKWYFYDADVQLTSIVNYLEEKQDTLKKPLTIINQKW